MPLGLQRSAAGRNDSRGSSTKAPPSDLVDGGVCLPPVPAVPLVGEFDEAGSKGLVPPQRRAGDSMPALGAPEVARRDENRLCLSIAGTTSMLWRRRPRPLEGGQADAVGGEVELELFDAVLAVGTTVIEAPDLFGLAGECGL